MNKKYIIDNWEFLHKDYARLNPDVVLSGINNKRSLLNHYIKYGYNENRKVSECLETQLDLNPNTIDSNKNTIIKEKIFILTDEMIKENII